MHRPRLFTHHCNKDFMTASLGRWTVVRYDGRTSCARRLHKWLCRCACGVEKSVRERSLVMKTTESCGCFQKERASAANMTHGQTASLNGVDHNGVATRKNIVEYNAWQGMRSRCYNEKLASFQDYGARGIVVCDRWLFGENGKSGAELFLQDVGHRPSALHSLDRIDNDGPYSPSNVRWATRSQQSWNKRSSVLIEINGQKLTIGEALSSCGYTRSQYYYTRKAGMTGQQVFALMLTTPIWGRHKT